MTDVDVWADLRTRFPPTPPRPRRPPVADHEAGGLAHQHRWTDLLCAVLDHATRHMDNNPHRYPPRNRTDTTHAWNQFRATPGRTI